MQYLVTSSKDRDVQAIIKQVIVNAGGSIPLMELKEQLKSQFNCVPGFTIDEGKLHKVQGDMFVLYPIDGKGNVQSS